MLVASYAGVTYQSAAPRWGPPAGMTKLGESDSENFSGSLDYGAQAVAGASGTKTASVNPAQDFAIAALTALRPATSPPTTTTLPPTTTTLPPPPPVISGVGASTVTASGATILWTTNLASDSQVEYGTTTSYGSATAVDATPVTAHSVGLTGLAAGTRYHYRVKRRSGAGVLATGADASFQTPPAGAVPLIVDTDIFSSGDDVGALAEAFGLQLKGEANVIAIGVNTRLTRPAVATNSWKCAAAIAQFYSPNLVPIGTDMPNNGTEVNTVDFVGPCAA
ncbi:MAG: fibronectin type III domain-containing protein, partial [Actinomycetota bacterium]|nr:fibronectin type III domain-containing protein [Actinomycetota bacterium]